MKRLSLFALFMAFACTVMAQVNRAKAEFLFGQGDGELNPALADNSRQLTVLDSIAADFEKVSIQNRYVILHSYTSPDGSLEVNENLARRRADVVEKTFDSQLKTDAHVIYKSHLFEWDEVEQMARVDDQLPNRDKVLAIFGSEERQLTIDNAVASDDLITKIKSIDTGETYSYIAKNYFPRLNRVVLEVRYMGNYSQPVAERRVISERVFYRDMTTGEVLDSIGVKLEPLQPEMPVTKEIEPVLTESQREYKDTVKVTEHMSFWDTVNHNLAVKTNLLYDVALVPNVGLEWRFSDHISASANWMYAWWSRDSKHDYWRIYGGDVELKYWFGHKSGRKLTGHHVGAYGGILTYDFEWGGKGYMGEKWSHMFGVSYGYSLPIAKHLNLDFNIGLGYLGGEYYEYEPEGDAYYWHQTKKRHWIGPTKAEISLVWLLGANNKRKK